MGNVVKAVPIKSPDYERLQQEVEMAEDDLKIAKESLESKKQQLVLKHWPKEINGQKVAKPVMNKDGSIDTRRSCLFYDIKDGVILFYDNGYDDEDDEDE